MPIAVSCSQRLTNWRCCDPEGRVGRNRRRGWELMGGEMVGATGFEPATSWSQTKCSTRLSYAPTPARGRLISHKRGTEQTLFAKEAICYLSRGKKYYGVCAVAFSK